MEDKIFKILNNLVSVIPLAACITKVWTLVKSYAISISPETGELQEKSNYWRFTLKWNTVEPSVLSLASLDFTLLDFPDFSSPLYELLCSFPASL